MKQIPTLQEIVHNVEGLALMKRKKAPQGRKPVYSDSFIIALTVYQKLASFRHAQQMLAVLTSLDMEVPAPSTFSERKAALVGQIILAVKQLCSGVQASRQHLDSKKLEVTEGNPCGIVDFARARRTKLSGGYGWDHIHDRVFYGLRVHARVDDRGNLCALLLCSANEHDVKVAPRLLEDLRYTIVTGDKGYISRELKREFAARAVDLVMTAGNPRGTPRRSNQLPPPKREQVLYKGHKAIETLFSSLDRLGLSERPYHSDLGLILHVCTTVLAYQLSRVITLCFVILHSRIGV